MGNIIYKTNKVICINDSNESSDNPDNIYKHIKYYKRSNIIKPINLPNQINPTIDYQKLNHIKFELFDIFKFNLDIDHKIIWRNKTPIYIGFTYINKYRVQIKSEMKHISDDIYYFPSNNVNITISDSLKINIFKNMIPYNYLYKESENYNLCVQISDLDTFGFFAKINIDLLENDPNIVYKLNPLNNGSEKYINNINKIVNFFDINPHILQIVEPKYDFDNFISIIEKYILWITNI